MNIYRVIEDGSDFLIKAKSMVEAVNICEEYYIVEALADHTDRSEKDERQFYYDEILQSCELLVLGELKN